MVEHQGVAPLYSGLEDPRIFQHLCSVKWNPVLELHQPLWFCKPPPELLGQRDE